MSKKQEPNQDHIWNATATERRRLADELEGLSPAQLKTQSQCDAWSVEEVAAHLVVPFETSTPKFLFAMLKNRGNFDKTILELTAKFVAKNSREDVVSGLRMHAENHWTPPGGGPAIPLSEVVVHGQDIRRVLGIENPVPAETIDLALNGIDDVKTREDYATRIGISVDQRD